MRISDWSSDVCSSDLQLHSSHPRLRIPDMTRPLPIAASLVLAALSFAAFAQTETETAPPATSESAPVPAAPAPAPVAPTGSAERGKQLTFPCQGCHGVVGYQNPYPHYQARKSHSLKPPP